MGGWLRALARTSPPAWPPRGCHPLWAPASSRQLLHTRRGRVRRRRAEQSDERGSSWLLLLLRVLRLRRRLLRRVGLLGGAALTVLLGVLVLGFGRLGRRGGGTG